MAATSEIFCRRKIEFVSIFFRRIELKTQQRGIGKP